MEEVGCINSGFAVQNGVAGVFVGVLFLKYPIYLVYVILLLGTRYLYLLLVSLAGRQRLGYSSCLILLLYNFLDSFGIFVRLYIALYAMDGYRKKRGIDSA